LRKSFGSLAMFAAIRRASSLVSSLAADLRPTDGRDDVRQIGSLSFWRISRSYSADR